MRESLPVLALVSISLLIACGPAAKAPEAEPDVVLEIETLGTQSSDPAVSTSETMRLPKIEHPAIDDSEQAIREMQARLEDEKDKIPLLLDIAEQALATARTIEEREPNRALGMALCAAFHARSVLVEALRVADPRTLRSDPQVLRSAVLYNQALSDVLALILESSGDAAIEARGPSRLYRLRWDLPPDWIWTPREFEFRPAERLEVQGLRDRHRTRGVGAPVVAVRREMPQLPVAAGEVFPAYERYYPLTALLTVEGDDGATVDAALHLIDPLERSTLEIAGFEVPVATDLSAGIAVTIGEVNPESIGEKGMFRPGKYMDQTGLYMMEPFREDKIPVVFIHGLGATAGTFLHMVNDLQADPEINRRYQFWFFNYPSGLSFGISAMLCRRTLDQAQAIYNPDGGLADMNRIVLVGHSMGGLISRVLVTPDMSPVWGAFFTKPIDELNLEPEDEEILRAVFFGGALPYVNRVLFLATPHRGSPFADNPIGKAGAGIATVPEEVKALARRVFDANEDALAPEVLARRRGEEGIRTTSPKSRLIKTLQETEISSGVTYHTIVGDRGKDAPLEESSDSIVPYSSSHLDGAASEVVVPSNHIVHDDPAGIEEVRRILMLHLEAGST